MKSEEGLLLATDTRPRRIGPDNNGTIIQLEDHLLAAVHVDNEPYEFGLPLMAHLVERKPAFMGSVSQYAAALAPILTQFVTGKSVPPFGLILAGPEPTKNETKLQFMGIHSSRQFLPIPFLLNVFGGVNSIARYIDAKLFSADMSMRLTKELAVFYITQTKSAILGQLEDSCCLVTLEPEKGVSWVGNDELRSILERNEQRSLKLRISCVDLFARSRGEK
jgi:hypothetical protein